MSLSDNKILQILLAKNNTLYAQIAETRAAHAVAGVSSVEGSILVELAAGDYIDIRLFHDEGSNLSSSTALRAVRVSIEQIE